MAEYERISEIKSISEDIVRTLLQDGFQEDSKKLKEAVELLSRTVYDLSTVCMNRESNHEETLKGTLAKVKISYNAVSKPQADPII